MSPGAVIGEAWALYKAHWRHFLPLALVMFAILGLISLLLAWALGWVGAVIGSFVSILGVFWLQGALVEAVADVRDGKPDLTLSETYERVRPRLGSIFVAGILAAIAIAIGFVLLIVPGLFLLTIWCLIVPVIVLEGVSAGDSFSRSRELVRGNGWNVFGLIVLMFLILIVASLVLALVLGWLPGWLGAYIRSVVTNTLIVPFVAIAFTVAYFVLKGTRETPAVEQPAT